MKLKLVCLSLAMAGLLLVVRPAMAIVDPLATPNNPIGIHILEPDEVEAAAKLVNGEGRAAWGYVTVPMQAKDRDRKKWGEFMTKSRRLKVIPIIRVATVAAGSNWEKPDSWELVDFANFLDSLDWPTKNRYVVIFNEVNHGAEYGGFVEPEHYARILDSAIRVFKDRSEDFFILPAAMDNATVSNGRSLNWREYLRRVGREVSGVFERIDGWNSHAYPNPAMAGRVADSHDHSVRSYQFDLRFLSSLGVKKSLPVFITETGWSQEVGRQLAADNLALTYRQVWSRDKVVAVTPFLLRAGEAPFAKFSFLDKGGQPNEIYRGWQAVATTVGGPALAGVQKLAGVGVTSGQSLPESNSDWFKLHLSSWRRFWEWLARWFKMG